MTTPPPASPPPSPPEPGAAVARERLGVGAYLDLYQAVGGPWRWDQRLRMPQGALAAHLAGPACAVHVLRLGREAAGFCELDATGFPSVQLVNFGLVPGATGRGLGPWLLDRALRAAWTEGPPPSRVWLHTDEWDHPRAVATYLRAGFAVERRAVEDAAGL